VAIIIEITHPLQARLDGLVLELVELGHRSDLLLHGVEAEEGTKVVLQKGAKGVGRE